TEALVARGHQVTLFATADSHTSAHLNGWPDQALRGRVANGEHLAMEMAHVLRLERDLAEFEVVHGHVTPEAAALTRTWATPTLHTLHGGIFPGMVPLMTALSDLAWVSISDAQRRPCPQANWL